MNLINKNLLSYLTAWVMVAFSPIVVAIDSGDTITETISEIGERDFYSFTGSSGDNIVLSVGGELDVYIFLQDPDGDVVDNRGTRRMFRELEKSGEYTVVIRSVQANATGEYDLHFVNSTGSTDSGIVTSQTYTITDGDLDSFYFSGVAGDTVVISGDSDFSLNFLLYGPAGQVVERSFNSKNPYTATLPSDGNYIIVAYGINGGTGEYTLSLETSGVSYLDSYFGTEQPCDGSSCANAGNSIDLAYGFKYQIETDFNVGNLNFTRYYRSGGSWINNTLGSYWRHNYSRRLRFYSDQSQNFNLDLVDGRGAVTRFVKNNDQWQSLDPDYQTSFTEIIDSETNTLAGYLYTTPNDTREYYDTNGLLNRIEYRGGRSISLTYGNSGQLKTVENETGLSLTLNYDEESRINEVNTPDGNYSYSYDNNSNLISVSKPDASIRTYHYEDTDHLNALTGITNENNIRVATYAYNAQGQAVLSQQAGEVDSYTLTYNEDGTTTATNPLGKQTTYHFETIQNVRKIVNVEGHVSANCVAANQGYAYNADGYLTSKTDWEGNVTEYERDSRGLVTTITEAKDTEEERITTITYNSTYRLPDTVTLDKLTTDYDFDTDGRLTAITLTDTNTNTNRTTTYSYYPNTVDENGNTILGRLHQINGARTDVNDVTTYEYDSNNRLIKTTNALGHETEIIDFDSSNRPTTIEDENNIRTALTYDELGRLSATTQGQGTPLTATTQYNYNAIGLLTSITLPNNVTLTYTYDDAQRLIGVEDALGNRISYTLDHAGNRTATSFNDAEGTLRYTHSQVFDELSRLIESTDANNDTDVFSYDRNSNLTNITDGNLNQTTFAFDSRDRLVSEIDAIEGETTSTPNDLDQTTAINNPKSNSTTYTYNAFDEVLTETSPDTGITSYTYDSAGNLITSTDARGVETNYQYDALNRLTSIIYPSDPTLNITYSYDTGENCGQSIGKLCSVTHAGGTTFYHYDILGRVTSVSETRGSLNFATSYTYDAAGTPTSMTLPSGRTVTYGLNANAQISSVSTEINGTNTTIAGSISYLPFGGIESFNFGNGIALTNTFNTAYQLTNRQIGTIFNKTYEYDAVGNITRISDKTYSYDELYRLISETDSSNTFSYLYDPIGGRLQKTVNGEETGYVYAPNSQRLQSTSGASNRNFTYDQNGNLTDNGNFQLTYGANNRLQKIDKTDLQANYTYDHTNLRIRKQINTADPTDYAAQAAEYTESANTLQARADHYTALVADAQSQIIEPPESETQRRINLRMRRLIYHYGRRATIAQNGADEARAEAERLQELADNPPLASSTVIHYVYNTDGLLIGEYTDSDELIREYIYLNGEPLAQIESNDTNTSEQVYYLHTDHLGTPRHATDDLSTEIWAWDSDAFGHDQAIGTAIVNLRFTGQYYDTESLFYYNWNRYYDPHLGQYISSDPIGLVGGLNTYTYALSNSINRTDPTGLIVEIVFDKDKGTVTITDVDTEATAIADAFSGFTADTAPAPNGTYTITSDPSGKSHYYGLMYHDAVINDFLEDHLGVDKKPRNGIRFHPGPISLGCVTVPSDERDDSTEQWRKIEEILMNTKLGPPFQYNSDGKIKNYGTMKIIGSGFGNVPESASDF